MQYDLQVLRERDVLEQQSTCWACEGGLAFGRFVKRVSERMGARRAPVARSRWRSQGRMGLHLFGRLPIWLAPGAPRGGTSALGRGTHGAEGLQAARDLPGEDFPEPPANRPTLPTRVTEYEQHMLKEAVICPFQSFSFGLYSGSST